MLLLFYETKEPFHVETEVPWYGLKHEYFHISIDFYLTEHTENVGENVVSVPHICEQMTVFSNCPFLAHIWQL